MKYLYDEGGECRVLEAIGDTELAEKYPDELMAVADQDAAIFKFHQGEFFSLEVATEDSEEEDGGTEVSVSEWKTVE